jgi:hypothetical protein
MAQQICHEIGNGVHVTPTSKSSIEEKVQELNRSISEVYKYELLTTNQYLKQMELVLEIFHKISENMDRQQDTRGEFVVRN